MEAGPFKESVGEDLCCVLMGFCKILSQGDPGLNSVRASELQTAIGPATGWETVTVIVGTKSGFWPPDLSCFHFIDQEIF